MNLYYTPESTPCRQVLLVGNVVGVDFDLKHIKLREGEHKTPEFLKINPQHSLPTFEDEDLILIESKAIIPYLCDKYGNDESLYPKDPQERVGTRALVNQRLWFDASLYSTYPRYFFSNIFLKAPEDPRMYSSLENSFELFDQLMEDREYAAVDHLTIADLCLVTTVSTYEALGIDIEKYPNVWKWYQMMLSTMPGLEVHNDGVEAFKASLP